ncbi:E3 ubiquitin-protein ligase TRIM39 [Acipenser ruthenus]|uniref:E3 ubiquitin-protein ligase TRIM39 n=1 Tax=Acipenser ruthenus TaxID=7906 RepID=A0A444UCW0_ACIRT|nr:E3 ubiquitin-protein ligase TRIM39 [Acipenser ruthenus]
MATAASSEEKFSCSVCLDLFTEPATIPCGHSFCLNCIGSYWDQSDQTGLYSCPQCRETFTPRPALRKNNVMTELVEELKKPRTLVSKKESAAPAPVSAESGGVPCDFCSGEIKRGAVRSCLTCLGSYCEAHLQPHYENAVLKRHALVQPLRDFEQKLCKLHQRLLELYCRTDQSCVCVLCQHSNHQDHTVILAERERVEKQKELGKRQAEIENLTEKRLKELETLKQAVESLKLSAQKERAESEQVLSELIRSVERIRTEVGELIEAKEKAAVSRANEQREQLEQEIQELRKRKAEMEQLSETKDHIHFLQSFQSVCAPPAAQQLFDNIDDSFWTPRKAVTRLKDHLEGFWKIELMKATVADLKRDYNQDGGLLAGFQAVLQLRYGGFKTELCRNVQKCLHTKTPEECACDHRDFVVEDSKGKKLCSRTRVTYMIIVIYLFPPNPLFSTVNVALDPDTTHPYLILSKDGKQVRPGDKLQPLPGNPKRFDRYVYVLGKEGFTSGRHYWEVEVGDKIGWRLGVTRESSQRKGSFPVNPQQGFWTVLREDECNNFYAATNPVTPLPKNLKPRKVGVYLDYEGGQLSFYNVETRSLIYTFTDTFTEKLYPLFSPGNCCSGKNPAPVIICPHTYTG